jgi:O-antigen ligase
MILYVQNRGAVVGLGAASLGMWPLARRRWLALAVVATVPAAVGYWALQTGLFERFRDIYSDGRFLGSAAERLEIWAGGLQIAPAHWLFGVGPDNFEFALQQATDGRLFINAHNSYVELLVEMGLPALILYLAVFLAGAIQLIRVAYRHAGNWRRTVAAGLLGSLTAHLAAGTFLSNPSLVWTWTLIGLTLPLALPERVGFDLGQHPARE